MTCFNIDLILYCNLFFTLKVIPAYIWLKLFFFLKKVTLEEIKLDYEHDAIVNSTEGASNFLEFMAQRE